MNRLFVFIAISILLLSCNEPEARHPISHASGSTINQSITINKKRIAIEEQEIKKYIESDSSIVYYPSEKGFWYGYNHKDTIATRTPLKGEVVQFNYRLETLNGTLLLSRKEIGNQAYQIDQSNQDLISGIRDGLKLMKEGETITLLLPSHKAYGYYGYEDKIDSNRPLKAIVTLLKIDNEPNK